MIRLNDKLIQTATFPNKETKISDFESWILPENVLEFFYREDGDLIHLLFVKSFLAESAVKCTLLIHYMPYSRMDRKLTGDLFTLKYVCQFINSMNFDQVCVVEPHSRVTMDLLDRSSPVFPVLDWLAQVKLAMAFSENDRIIFPDKGAAARYQDAGLSQVCVFEKTRNPSTGRIEGMFLKEGDLPVGANCLIIDDLCSKGGTFLAVGSLLKDLGAQRINLLVTHCEETIFAGKLLDEGSPISQIYTSNSMMHIAHPQLQYLTLNLENYV